MLQSMFPHLTVAFAVLIGRSCSETNPTEEKLRQSYFTACTDKGFTSNINSEKFTVNSVIECGNRCLHQPDCSSFNIWDQGKGAINRYKCQLSYYEEGVCSSLTSDPTAMHYYSVLEEETISMSTSEPESPTTEPEVSTTEPEVSTTAPQWITALIHDGTKKQGTVYDLFVQASRISDMVVRLDTSAGSRVIALDSVHVSAAPEVLTGGAYLYEANDDDAGNSFFGHIRVNTNGKASVSGVDSGGAVFDTEFYPLVYWYTRELATFEMCANANPPNFGAHTLALSYRGHQGYLLYTGYSKMAQKAEASFLGLFIRDWMNSAVFFKFHLRENNMTHYSEKFTTVNINTGEGDGELKDDPDAVETYTGIDTCWTMIYQTNLETKPTSEDLEQAIKIIQTGLRIYIQIYIWDTQSYDFVLHALEIERVELTISTIPLIGFHTKVGAIYQDKKLQWNFFSVYTNDTIFLNGYHQSEVFTYDIYAELRRRPYKFTIDHNSTITEGSHKDAYYRILRGRLPRLMIQYSIDKLDFFDIEYAKALSATSIELRSYRSMSSTIMYTNVFTFDVVKCEYSLEQYSSFVTKRWVILPNTKAMLMTLFFEA